MGWDRYEQASSNPCASPDHTGKRESHIISDKPGAVLRKTEAKKSLGLDKIPSYIFKGCMEFLVAPLAYIFNSTIRSGKVSLIGEVTKIRPIPKTEMQIT